MGVKSLQDQLWSAGITLQDLILSVFAYINHVKNERNGSEKWGSELCVQHKQYQRSNASGLRTDQQD